MKKSTLVMQADQLLKTGDFEYAIGGGQAIDLFLGYESRVHGDIDVVAFWKDRDKIIQFMHEYYGAAEPPVRRGESHLSGLTEPPCQTLTLPA